jgi:hypothetical protein
MGRVLLTAGVILFMSACSTVEDASLNSEVYEEGVYRNEYLGFRILLPQDWSLQNEEMEKRLTKAGSDYLGHNESESRVMQEQAEETVNYLFTLFKYPLGTVIDYNPNIIGLAENVADYPGIKTGKEYLQHVRNQLLAAQADFVVSDVSDTYILDGRTFYVLRTDLNFMGTIVKQRHYATKINEYILLFTYSYQKKESEEELLKILKSVVFF